MNKFSYRTPLMAAFEKYEHRVYMLDLLKDCNNCFLLFLIIKISSDKNIINISSTTLFHFLLRKVFETYQVYYTILLITFKFAFILKMNKSVYIA